MSGTIEPAYWKLRHCDYNLTESLVDYLRRGWEPFAVTEPADDGPPVIWLRKRVTDAADANLVSI